MARAQAYVEPYIDPKKVPIIRWQMWVWCDACPDEFYGPPPESEEEEEYLCGSCWDSGLDVSSCLHLKRMKMDDAPALWIECDSEGWNNGAK